MLAAALALLTALYAVSGILLAAAARRGGDERHDTSNRPFVSVLVAARDEEAMLPECLTALQAQAYPSDRYEIIVADDHSADRTAEIARSRGIRCVRLGQSDGGEHDDVAKDGTAGTAPAAASEGTSSAAEGKAAALHAALRASRGEILAVTDADCRPPAGWLAGMVSHFDDPSRGVVCGVTTVSGGGVLARIQALDWLLLLTVASGFSTLGLPLTAMGNNMAFRRVAYEDVGGYPALPPSVTEDYALFREIGRRKRWTVHLYLHERLRNVTAPLPSLRKVISQRKRWARGGLRADPWVYLFYVMVFATHAVIAAALVLTPSWGLAALAAKTASDAVVSAAGAAKLKQRRLWSVLPLFEVYFFAYVLALPLVLLFSPAVKWRGRRW